MTHVIFFDLRKAFDSVSHSLLLQRLEEVGTNQYLVQWIYSNLSGRSQSVVVSGEESSVLPVISGVPQGSVLGPLLFIIFINEIIHQISLGSSISLFADDIALYRPILSDMDFSILQRDVNAIVFGLIFPYFLCNQLNTALCLLLEGEAQDLLHPF